MIHYKRYRPAFFEGFTSEEGEVETVAELLSIPWIDSWSKEPGFHQFSLSRDDLYPTNGNLMAELDDGYLWWVVAKVWDDDIELCSLPLWESKYREGENQQTL